ncbi:MAG TPA: hypothetical protein VGS41_06790, partial [Chthonomonadales bacterium]|nr:hypothetical protein [Chthonomonadales bacterium]
MRRIWLAAATIAAGFLASGCSDRITPARNIQAAAARAVHITAAAAAKDMSADEFYSVNGQGPYVVTGVVSSTGNRNGYYAELETGGASSTVCRFGKRDPDVRTGRKISVFA